jgi:hypothetical protein
MPGFANPFSDPFAALHPARQAPLWTLTATTGSAAQTVTLQSVNPTRDVTVDWGDGASDRITAGNTAPVAHVYASAGAYTVTLPRIPYTSIVLQDAKLGFVVSEDNPLPPVTRDLSLRDIDLEWTVSAALPFPLVDRLVMLRSLPDFAWTVSADLPFPPVTDYAFLYDLPGLTWAADADLPFPAITGYLSIYTVPGLTWGSGAAANLHSIEAITVDNALTQAAVNALLADLYSVFAARTRSGDVDLDSVFNAAPGGTLQAACPPTTGKEYAYELVNDSCGLSDFHWTTVAIRS